MEVHRSSQTPLTFRNAVITTGTFDGVHRGHQKLIEQVNGAAEKINGESVLITFDPHPRSVVYPGDLSLRLLSTTDEKIALLRPLGIDHLVIVPFTKEFSLLSAKEYVANFLVLQFQPSIIVIGYNHQFGHHRDGNIELLRKLSAQYHFKIEEMLKQMVDDIEISSTRIRIALIEGDVTTARQLLGHYYSVSGTVIKGNQLGRKLGYPTANIAVSDEFKLVPADGIYAIRIDIDGETKNGVLSIGMRPTINGTERTIEAYVFGFSGDLYDKKLTLHFIRWIREERKFDTLDLMVDEIRNDEIKARKILAEELR